MNQQNNNQLERELQTIGQAITEIVRKNPNSRQEFNRNPRAAIYKYLQLQLPAELNIKTIDQSDPTAITFVLPQAPRQELNNNGLRQISGGTDHTCIHDSIIRNESAAWTPQLVGNDPRTWGPSMDVSKDVTFQNLRQ